MITEREDEEGEDEEEPITFDIPYLSDQDILPCKHTSYPLKQGQLYFL